MNCSVYLWTVLYIQDWWEFGRLEGRVPTEYRKRIWKQHPKKETKVETVKSGNCKLCGAHMMEKVGSEDGWSVRNWWVVSEELWWNNYSFLIVSMSHHSVRRQYQTHAADTYFILVRILLLVSMVVVPNSMSDSSDNSGWSKMDS